MRAMSTIGVREPPRETTAASILQHARRAFEVINGHLAERSHSSGGFFCVADSNGEGMFCGQVPLSHQSFEDEASAWARRCFSDLADARGMTEVRQAVRVGQFMFYFDGFISDTDNRTLCLLVAVWSDLITLVQALERSETVFLELYTAGHISNPA